MALSGGAQEQAASFGAAAALYDRARPSYPEAAVDLLLPVGAQRVLDLGAGTGKLTHQLVARSLDVVAVDPSPGMLAQLRAALPNVPTHPGSAESIPLPDNSVDAVVVAQAWHWVDVERAVAEVARVLRPGGRLGLVWNVRDENHDWVAQLGRLMRRGDEQDMNTDAPAVGAAFAPIERRDVAWTHVCTRVDLLDLVASRSYVITMPQSPREQLLTRVAVLLDQHPDLQTHRHIKLPYIARCSRTHLL